MSASLLHFRGPEACRGVTTAYRAADVEEGQGTAGDLLKTQVSVAARTARTQGLCEICHAAPCKRSGISCKLSWHGSVLTAQACILLQICSRLPAATKPKAVDCSPSSCPAESELIRRPALHPPNCGVSCDEGSAPSPKTIRLPRGR